ncbi:MAG: polysaccharide lyase family 7 protein [Candidatus Moranbacteria bacterium]|nr:polysaccharide lyase family 7 protein [Candidatus Moranbacteria bacterium]
MKKNLNMYLALLMIILPIGGFFLYQNFFTAGVAEIAEAKKSVSDQKSADAPLTAQAEPETGQGAEQEAVDIEPAVANEAAVVRTGCSYPSQILDLAEWKQTLPTGSSKKPVEIKQASLASYSLNPYFFPNATCDGVVFRAPVNGVTTSGSGYPRSELREMKDGGKTLASWSTSSGTHSMFIDQAITAVPKTKKHVVAGQIHDADDDVVVVRLEYPKLFVDINGKTGPTLDPNYTLGKRFTVKFVAANGQIKIYYNGSATPAYTMDKKSSGNYFKAGAYTQSNCSKEKSCSDSNFGEVVIHKLTVQH